MVTDPRLERLAAALRRRPHEDLPRLPVYREAGVALVLRPGDGFELLLIKRAEQEGDPWSGHMALPGGRREPGDADLRATAARETREETGIALATRGRFLGPLDEVAPVSRRLPPYVIAPFVAAVPAGTEAIPEPREVAAALWVPLAALRQDHAVSEILVELGGDTRSFPSLRIGEHEIWGLTHRILTGFLDIAAECGL
ncbi:MAG: CoA pyrophosphatase [Gemmatimonadota bacterium]